MVMGSKWRTEAGYRKTGKILTKERMQLTWHIVHDWDRFLELTRDWSDLVVADVETFGKLADPHSRLLGLALSPVNKAECSAVYVPFWHFNQAVSRFEGQAPLNWSKSLGEWLRDRRLIGHNFTYDEGWVNRFFGLNLEFEACTRILWHLSAAPSGPAPYGLKDAQIQLLKWTQTNEGELEAAVRASGGSLEKGDHYLASLQTLARYACLDTFSTAAVFNLLAPFLDRFDYWGFLRFIMAYARLLAVNEALGVKVDLKGLKRALIKLEKTRDENKAEFLRLFRPEISILEQEWRDERAAAYKLEKNREKFLETPEKWKRLNLNSDPQKRALFFDICGFKSMDKTESGLPSTSEDSLRHIDHPGIRPYMDYNHAETLINSFVNSYLQVIDDVGPGSRLYPRFNICATVSYRLGGFKPYLLNAPFSEEVVYRNFTVDDGYEGIHADLSAIEPTVTAHYSEDPTLLKVFRDGLGDIYLDLAKDIFKDDQELQEGYDSYKPITKVIKERFAKQRKVAKVIQLAVQYTGTGHTVAKNLTKDGIPTSVEEANGYVRAYWSKFHAVARFEYQLKKLNRTTGHLRNVIGRVIRVPDPDYKDLMNRFVQSSAHDILMLWVMEISRLTNSTLTSNPDFAKLNMKPVILDIHDSTTWQTKRGTYAEAKEVFETALDNVNRRLGLSVQVKCEIKRFHSLAGLKVDEES